MENGFLSEEQSTKTSKQSGFKYLVEILNLISYFSPTLSHTKCSINSVEKAFAKAKNKRRLIKAFI